MRRSEVRLLFSAPFSQHHPFIPPTVEIIATTSLLRLDGLGFVGGFVSVGYSKFSSLFVSEASLAKN